VISREESTKPGLLLVVQVTEVVVAAVTLHAIPSSMIE
jgi:hypothetical protein